MKRRPVRLSEWEVLHLATMGCLLATHWAAYQAVAQVPRSVTWAADQAGAALTALLWGLAASTVAITWAGTRLRGRNGRVPLHEDFFPFRDRRLRCFLAAAAWVLPALLLPLAFPWGRAGWSSAAFCSLVSMSVLWGPLFAVGLTSSRLAAGRRRAEVAAQAQA